MKIGFMRIFSWERELVIPSANTGYDHWIYSTIIGQNIRQQGNNPTISCNTIRVCDDREEKTLNIFLVKGQE